MKNTKISSVDRFLSMYEQQDCTASKCGFDNYIDMAVNFWYDEYAGLAYVSQEFPFATRVALY